MRLTFKRKLIGSYLAVLLITFLLGAFSGSVLNRQTDTFHKIMHIDNRLFAAAKEIELLLLQHRRYEKEFFLNIGKPEEQNTYLEKYMEKSVTLKGLIEQFGALVDENKASYLTQDIRNKTQLLFEKYASYYRGFYEVADRVRADATMTPQKAEALMMTYETTVYELESDIADVVSAVAAGIDRSKIEADAKGGAAKRALRLFSAICALFIVILGLVFTRHISKPMKNASSLAGESQEVRSKLSSVLAAGEQDSIHRSPVTSTAEDIDATV